MILRKSPLRALVWARAQRQRLKCAFDAEGLLNPGKMFPTLHRCAELGRVPVHAGKLAFPDIPRL